MKLVLTIERGPELFWDHFKLKKRGGSWIVTFLGWLLYEIWNLNFDRRSPEHTISDRKFLTQSGILPHWETLESQKKFFTSLIQRPDYWSMKLEVPTIGTHTSELREKWIPVSLLPQWVTHQRLASSKSRRRRIWQCWRNNLEWRMCPCWRCCWLTLRCSPSSRVRVQQSSPCFPYCPWAEASLKRKDRGVSDYLNLQ